MAFDGSLLAAEERPKTAAAAGARQPAPLYLSLPWDRSSESVTLPINYLRNSMILLPLAPDAAMQDSKYIESKRSRRFEPKLQGGIKTYFIDDYFPVQKLRGRLLPQWMIRFSDDCRSKD